MGARACSKHRRNQFAECVRPVAHGVFFLWIKFCKGLAASLRHEHRVITKAKQPTWRPCQAALHTAFENFLMPVGPSQRQSADELGAPIGVRSKFGQLALNLAHRHIPVTPRPAFEHLRFRPVGGVDPWRTVQGGNAQAAVIGQRGKAGTLRRRMGLEQSIFGKTGAGFVRFRQAKFARRYRFDPKGRSSLR